MNAFKGKVQMLLKDISLVCLPGRLSADSFFLDFVRRLSIFKHCITCCVHCAFLLQGAKYQSFVSLWRKLNKTLEYKEDSLQRDMYHTDHGGAAVVTLCTTLLGSQHQSFMSKANYFIETS